MLFALFLGLERKPDRIRHKGRLETDPSTDHPVRGVINSELGQPRQSNLEVAEASRAFESAIPAAAAARHVQNTTLPAHQTPPSDAVPPEVVATVRQEYDRVVQKRTRLQELMRLEEEEEMLMRQLHASSSPQSIGPPTELPSTEPRRPAELPP